MTFPLFCVILVAFSWGKGGGEGGQSYRGGASKHPPNPGSRGQKKPARNRGLNEFAFLFLTLKTNIYDDRLSYDVLNSSQLIDINCLLLPQLNSECGLSFPAT